MVVDRALTIGAQTCSTSSASRRKVVSLPPARSRSRLNPGACSRFSSDGVDFTIADHRAHAGQVDSTSAAPIPAAGNC